MSLHSSDLPSQNPRLLVFSLHLQRPLFHSERRRDRRKRGRRRKRRRSRYELLWLAEEEDGHFDTLLRTFSTSCFQFWWSHTRLQRQRRRSALRGRLLFPHLLRATCEKVPGGEAVCQWSEACGAAEPRPAGFIHFTPCGFLIGCQGV